MPATSTQAKKEKAKAGEPLILKLKGNRVDGEWTPNSIYLESLYVVAPCRCKCWFCEKCCVSMGLDLRTKLIPKVEQFTRPIMWTLTLDPLLFESPAAAFDYVTSKRKVAEFVRALRKKDCLNSHEFFCVVEWQKQTEMPHWHLLLDADYIDFDLCCSIWNRYRPKTAGPVQGNRPPFGSIRFSMPKFADARHAACYATKYLIKYPEHGYPAWVLDFPKRICRHSSSKGFFPPKKKNAGNTKSNDEKKPRNTTRTVRERIAKCGVTGVILEKKLGLNEKGVPEQITKYHDTLLVPMADFRGMLPDERRHKGGHVHVTPEEVKGLRGEHPNFPGEIRLPNKHVSDPFSNPHFQG